MINLNNKGQSLVMFILIIPILLLMLVIVADVGNALVKKQELDNVNYLTLEYGLEHIDELGIEHKMKNIAIKNDDEINNINIVFDTNKITVTIKKEINGVIANQFKVLELESKYIGYIKNGKKIIERV